jgi:hypothetical protein
MYLMMVCVYQWHVYELMIHRLVAPLIGFWLSYISVAQLLAYQIPGMIYTAHPEVTETGIQVLGIDVVVAG